MGEILTKSNAKKDKKNNISVLWKCPRCGREFKRQEQGHYCGEKARNVEEYILSQDEDKREDLFRMQEILRKALPEAQEKIAWSMPTYWKEHNILHFAASKKNIGFYPGPEAVEEFQDRMEYASSKGTIRIPYGKIDEELIEAIARWCWETGNHA